jgi:hypothetical protein
MSSWITGARAALNSRANQSALTLQVSGQMSRARALMVSLSLCSAVATIVAIDSYARRQTGAELVVSAAGATVALVFFWLLLNRQLTARRHAHVVAARPGAEVVEVWAPGIYEVMTTAGLAPRHLRRGRMASLTMAVMTGGVELWCGTGFEIKVLAQLRWTSVSAIRPTDQPARSGTTPALMLVASLGSIVLIPRVRANGGAARSVDEVGALAGRLAALRSAAVGWATRGDRRQVR